MSASATTENTNPQHLLGDEAVPFAYGRTTGSPAFETVTITVPRAAGPEAEAESESESEAQPGEEQDAKKGVEDGQAAEPKKAGKPRMPAGAEKALRAFVAAGSSTPDGTTIVACQEALATVRAQAAALSEECFAALDSYHKEPMVYPTATNGSYQRLVDIVEARGGEQPTLRVGISGAAAGELASELLRRVTFALDLYQSDLRPGQAAHVYDIDVDAWPLTGDGGREAIGQTDMALARHCFYDLPCSFLTLWAMCGTLRSGGLLAVVATRKQLGNVAPFLLEAHRTGVLSIDGFEPVALRADAKAFGSYLITATRTEISHEAVERLPTLLGTTCSLDGPGGALAMALEQGLAVATQRERLEDHLGCTAGKFGQLTHAYKSVAAGELVIGFSSVLTDSERRQLREHAQSIGASGAPLMAAALQSTLRTGALPALERLSHQRLANAAAAPTEDAEAQLAALRMEPASAEALFGAPYEQLVGNLATTPCLYIGWAGDQETHQGMKMGVASRGINSRYGAAKPTTRAVPIARLLPPLAHGHSSPAALPAFPVEAEETMLAIVGGGLGKGAVHYGSAGTLSAKPGITGSTFKKGFVGNTEAQKKSMLAPPTHNTKAMDDRTRGLLQTTGLPIVNGEEATREFGITVLPGAIVKYTIVWTTTAGCVNYFKPVTIDGKALTKALKVPNKRMLILHGLTNLRKRKANGQA